MKFRIPKILLPLTLAMPVGYGAIHAVRTESLGSVMETVWFYSDLPARLSEAEAKFKRLPERMDPTCSECN